MGGFDGRAALLLRLGRAVSIGLTFSRSTIPRVQEGFLIISQRPWAERGCSGSIARGAGHARADLAVALELGRRGARRHLEAQRDPAQPILPTGSFRCTSCRSGSMYSLIEPMTAPASRSPIWMVSPGLRNIATAACSSIPAC